MNRAKRAAGREIEEITSQNQIKNQKSKTRKLLLVKMLFLVTREWLHSLANEECLPTSSVCPVYYMCSLH